MQTFKEKFRKLQNLAKLWGLKYLMSPTKFFCNLKVLMHTLYHSPQKRHDLIYDIILCLFYGLCYMHIMNKICRKCHSVLHSFITHSYIDVHVSFNNLSNILRKSVFPGMLLIVKLNVSPKSHQNFCTDVF